MEKQLICEECRAKSASQLSCIHTFAPRVHRSLAAIDKSYERDEQLRIQRELIENARDLSGR